MRMLLDLENGAKHDDHVEILALAYGVTWCNVGTMLWYRSLAPPLRARKVSYLNVDYAQRDPVSRVSRTHPHGHLSMHKSASSSGPASPRGLNKEQNHRRASPFLGLVRNNPFEPSVKSGFAMACAQNRRHMLRQNTYILLHTAGVDLQVRHRELYPGVPQICNSSFEICWTLVTNMGLPCSLLLRRACAPCAGHQNRRLTFTLGEKPNKWTNVLRGAGGLKKMVRRVLTFPCAKAVVQVSPVVRGVEPFHGVGTMKGKEANRNYIPTARLKSLKTMWYDQ